MRSFPRPLFISQRIGLTFIALVAIGFSVSLTPVRANDDPKREAMQAAHDLLMKAHDESDAHQRIVDLEAARSAIRHSSPGAPGPHRRGAMDQLDAAIRQIKLGDPSGEANRFIENANKRIGY